MSDRKTVSVIPKVAHALVDISSQPRDMTKSIQMADSIRGAIHLTNGHAHKRAQTSHEICQNFA